jgi:hypothetical protein
MVPGDRPEVVYVARPSSSVALPIAPAWSRKVTVPPSGVAPPGDRSETVAVKVIDVPEDAVAINAVRVGRVLNRARCSRAPTCGRHAARARGLPDREARGTRREEVTRNAIMAESRRDPAVRRCIVRLL